MTFDGPCYDGPSIDLFIDQCADDLTPGGIAALDKIWPLAADAVYALLSAERLGEIEHDHPLWTAPLYYLVKQHLEGPNANRT